MDEPFEEIGEGKKKAGIFSVFEVLYSPSRAFRQIIDAGHAWIYPAIIFALILEMGIIMEIPLLQEQIAEPAMLLPEGEKISESIIIITIVFISIFLLPIGFFAIYIVPSLIYIFIGNFVFEGKAGFRQVLNVTAYASIPYLIGNFLANTISSIMRMEFFTFNPSVLFPAEMQATFLGIWLGMFNPLLIWQVALTIIGLSLLYNHTKAKTAAWFIPLYLAFYTFFALVFSLLGKFAEDWGIS